MKTILTTRLLVTVGLSLLCTGVARAEDTPSSRPIPEERQNRLLARFGEEGIDADADGVLTRGEVRAFFEAKRGGGPHGRRGGPPIPGAGRQGHLDRKMQRLGMKLRHVEALSADTPPEKLDPGMLAEADTDGDGKVSQVEWRTFSSQKRGEILARLADHLPDADADGDGTLSETELGALRARFHEHLLGKHPEADTNGDGTLSVEEADAFHAARQEEHRARILERHPDADSNGDGVLSDAEMRDFLKSRAGHRGPHGRGMGGPREKP